MILIKTFVNEVAKSATILAILCLPSVNLMGKAAREIKKLPFDVCVFFGEYRPRAAAYVFQTKNDFLRSNGILFNSVVEVSSLDESGSCDLAVRISQPNTLMVQADVYSVAKKMIVFSFSAKGPGAAAKIVKTIHRKFITDALLYKQILAEKQSSPKGTITTKNLVSENAPIEFNSTENKSVIADNNLGLNTILSDVDENIPSIQRTNPLRFALIIGNEDYGSFQPDLNSEVNVAFAVNDAKVFEEYAKSVLEVPEENIIYIINARTVEMNRAIEKMNLCAKNTNGKAELFFYYAGHGLPDEATKESYLIPVDVTSSDLKFAIKLKNLYGKLTEFPTQRVTVFIDACFSGGARNQGLVAARGVKVKPKEELLAGNLVVFTASSGEQSSLAYKNKQHGMFTYFLLKKLQETKGDLTYKDLSEYLISQVGLKSVMVNDKEQNPQVNVSPNIQNMWMQWTINE